MEPITREEIYLNAIAGSGEVPANLVPVTREEMFLNAIATNNPAGIEPLTRKEKYLNAIASNDSAGVTPLTREEVFLDAIAENKDAGITPITREEYFLQAIIDNKETIPIGEQLIDFDAVKSGYVIDEGAEQESQWSSCSDYTLINTSMTFSYIGYEWYGIYFYDEDKTYLNSYIYMHEDADSIEGGYASGTLTPEKMPDGAVYVRISSYPNIVDDTMLSLIRTA